MRQPLSVRLDPETAQKLSELVEHYNSEAVGKVTASDIIRMAVHATHKQFLSAARR